MLPYSDFLSFKLKGEEPENFYQLVSTQENFDAPVNLLEIINFHHEIEPGRKFRYTGQVDKELEQQVINYLFFQNLFPCIFFFSFHLNKYLDNHPGQGINFLCWLENIVNESYLVLNENRTVPKGTKDHIIEWVDSVKKELNTPSNTNGDTKTPVLTLNKPPKLNEYNKPSLTRTQISILFKIMKNKRIIANRDLTNVDYAKVLDVLTGFSEKQIRPSLSENELISISAAPKDYESIITSLYQVIHELEIAKNEIG